MIIEFTDGTTANFIAFVDSYGQINGSIKSVENYIRHSHGYNFVAVIKEYGNSETYDRIYPIDKVLCIHRDKSTLRNKKIDSVLD